MRITRSELSDARDQYEEAVANLLITTFTRNEIAIAKARATLTIKGDIWDTVLDQHIEETYGSFGDITETP